MLGTVRIAIAPALVLCFRAKSRNPPARTREKLSHWIFPLRSKTVSAALRRSSPETRLYPSWSSRQFWPRLGHRSPGLVGLGARRRLSRHRDPSESGLLCWSPAFSAFLGDRGPPPHQCICPSPATDLFFGLLSPRVRLPPMHTGTATPSHSNVSVSRRTLIELPFRDTVANVRTTVPQEHALGARVQALTENALFHCLIFYRALVRSASSNGPQVACTYCKSDRYCLPLYFVHPAFQHIQSHAPS